MNAGAVTIQHNAHLKSQVAGLQTVSVRVGDTLVAGSAIGNIAPSATLAQTTIKLAVYMDGIAVCPYSFMNSTARAFVNSNFNFSGFAGRYCE